MGRFAMPGDAPGARVAAVGAELALAGALIRTSFRQQLAYRAATLGGLATNAVFGAFLASIYGAVYAARGDAPVGALDRDGALTYVWLTQALIVPTMVWGSWDIATAIRSGDIVADLLKPMSFFGYWLSRDVGRALAGMLLRFTPTILLGAVFYPIVVPGDVARWVVFALGLAGAVGTSFAVRFAMNMVAFWWNDLSGLRSLQLAIIGFLSGFLMPLDFYPGWLRGVLDVLPFRGMIMTPVDLWLGNGDTAGLLLAQWGWLAVLVVFARWLFRRAVRKVVVQGG